MSRPGRNKRTTRGILCKRPKIGRLFSAGDLATVWRMSKRSSTTTRGDRGFGRVTDVRFIEVEFEAPQSAPTRMVIEVEGGLRLLVADDASVELAAKLLNALGRLSAPAKGGRSEELV